MPYEIIYYAYGEEDRQPSEEFEDELERSAPRLLGKLRGVTVRIARELPRSAGGGLWEKVRGSPGLWEVRTIFGGQLARYFATLDGEQYPPRLVLLGGIVKQTGERTRVADFERAARSLRDYRRTRRVSDPRREDPADEQI